MFDYNNARQKYYYILGRGFKNMYVLSMMLRPKCIMVKVRGSPKTEKNENRKKFINFAEIEGICNMHHWLR